MTLLLVWQGLWAINGENSHIRTQVIIIVAFESNFDKVKHLRIPFAFQTRQTIFTGSHYSSFVSFHCDQSAASHLFHHILLSRLTLSSLCCCLRESSSPLSSSLFPPDSAASPHHLSTFPPTPLSSTLPPPLTQCSLCAGLVFLTIVIWAALSLSASRSSPTHAPRTRILSRRTATAVLTRYFLLSDPS